jgi:DNA-binding MarR family transcriptional regulator
MAERLSDLELGAWQALLHSHHKLTRVLDAELIAEHDLTLGQYDVLLRLARAPDHRLPMAQLAQRVMISPSGLTRVVDGLVKQGLVRRSRSETDGRVILTELTEKGWQTIKRAAQTHLRGIREHYTSQLTATQLRQVTTALERISGPHQPH